MIKIQFPFHKIRILQSALFLGSALILTGCYASDRLAEVGRAPALSPIQNPYADPQYRPVSMPMPIEDQAAYERNSLWRPGSVSFFKDGRAKRVGDILTVNINIQDKGEIKNSTNSSRNGTNGLSIGKILGLEHSVSKFLPETADPNETVNNKNTTKDVGTGSTIRGETVNLKIAAVIIQMLPNGNMVIKGRQETRINFEVRDLEISGIVRQQDISPENNIDFTKIAEARISYGGRGSIQDVQQPGWGTQVVRLLSPF